MIIKNAKAAILIEQKKPLIIDSIQFPINLEIGQVLVKILYSGICGSQIGEIDGVKGKDNYLPHLLGHEASGIVEDVGPGVKSVKKSDHVVLHWKKGHGIESDNPRYTWQKNPLNAGLVTTFNEWGIISENRLTAIPKNICLKQAALYGCAVTTGFGVIQNEAKAKIGDSVVICGAGGIGLNMIQAAKIAGCYPIIAIDKYENRLNLALEIGATHIINSQNSSVEDQINAILNNDSIDIFIDNTGIPKFIEMAYKITPSNGKIILVGVPSSDSAININTLPLHFGKLLIGSHGGSTNPTIDIPKLMKVQTNGIFNLEKILTKEYKLEEINIAIQEMRTGILSGRALICF